MFELFSHAVAATPYGQILSGEPLPPRLYEILNVSIVTSAFVTWVITLRYLITALVDARRSGAEWFNAFRTLFSYKLAVGFLIFLSGEWPRMAWVWFARYVENTRGAPFAAMSSFPLLLIPVIGSVLTVLGLACIVRALIPTVWGRYAYRVTLTAVVCIVALTQIVRP